jgi:phage terminase large subunit
MAAAEVAARTIDYTPRPPFEGFHSSNKRWTLIVAHRRAGKTVACIVELLTAALSTSKTNARYAYIAPYYGQAKQVAWDYLKRFAAQVAVKVSESELSVDLANGSRIRLYGADNPDSLRGMYLDGVVLDEYADMRSSVWGEIIRPLLADRQGWAVFIGTPKGRNAFCELYEKAQKNSEWLCLTLKASETKLLAQKELDDARKVMTESQYEQEFECSFEAAIHGAVYAKELKRVRAAGRIRKVPYDSTRLVETFWDLGRGDPTSIWFYQNIAGEKRFIDYFEDHGETITYYLSILRSRGYQYDTLWLPHDAEHKHMETDKSVADICRANNFKVRIVPNLPLAEGINAARLLLATCYFDEEKCAPGIEGLQSYRWDFNERLEELKSVPVHDWASHPADGFRYAAVAERTEKPKTKAIKYDMRGIV